MSEKLLSNTKEVSEEFKVPEFYNSNWRDDVPEGAKEIDDMLKFEYMKGENKYVSPSKISKEAEDKILFRKKRMELVGKRVLALR